MSEIVNNADRLHEARMFLKALAEESEEWCGIPMPLGKEEELVIEPSYPYANLFNDKEVERDDEDYRVRNSFVSRKRQCVVHVYEESAAPGKVKCLKIPRGPRRTDMEIKTMACSDAWGVIQEQKALQTLATMIRHHHFKRYLLTGMFLESSKRSGVVYIFRKLRPTIALKAHGEKMEILCALCMHPIGYYMDTWAGSMCPTDDVIAHLALMRGDEHMFWKRCNQHQPDAPGAGL